MKTNAKQWNKDSLPDNEVPVLVIVEHSYPGQKPSRDVIIAFYEDGTVEGKDSRFFWDLMTGLVPRGWYELTDYGDESFVITDDVVAWQSLPDPADI